jgi:hypothetical protein
LRQCTTTTTAQSDPAVDHHATDFKSDKAFKLRPVYSPSELLNFDFKSNHDGYRGGSYYFAITRPVGAPFPTSDPSSNSNTFTYQPASLPISVNYSKIADESLRATYNFGFATLASVSAHSLAAERYGIPGEGIGGDQPGDLDFTPADIIGIHNPMMSTPGRRSCASVRTEPDPCDGWAVCTT